MRPVRVLLAAVVAVAVAGCGGSTHRTCTVRPSADGRSLLYSPAGCQHHLNGVTLNVLTSPAP